MSHVRRERVGTTLQGRYRLLDQLAEGAMGTVYRAERLGLGRPVAVKFLRADLARDPAFVERFARETRALGRLAHPHCIAVLDFGVEGGADGVPYLVMELAPGESLRAIIRRGPLAPRRAVSITRQVLAALAHAHEKGIVHRDAKPENIVVEQGGIGDDHVRVIDFGLSRVLDETSRLTEGLLIGTPSYMAPEQLEPGPIDARVDVYTTGVVLYEMLTGCNPFKADSLGATMVAQRLVSPPPPRTVHPALRISAALLAVLGRALGKSPAERFPTAQAMLAALDAVPERAPPGLAGASVVGGYAGVVVAWGRQRLGRVGGAVVAWGGQRLGPVLLEGLRGCGVRLGRLGRLLLPALARAGQLGRLLVPALARPLARARRLGPFGLASVAFAFGFAAVFALVLSARSADGRSAPAGAVAMARLAPAVPPAETPPEAPSLSRAASEAQTALKLAEEAFEQRRFGDGVDYFRFAARRDPQVRGNGVLVDHVIDGLASPRHAPQASALLRTLGAAARPHVRQAARTHANPAVRQRAAALLPPPARRPFLRWLPARRRG